MELIIHAWIIIMITNPLKFISKGVGAGLAKRINEQKMKIDKEKMIS